MIFLCDWIFGGGETEFLPEKRGLFLGVSYNRNGDETQGFCP
jgi:hypothetical protein